MDGYQILLRELKLRIRTARLQAALAVNQELILLHWGIGREILERQAREGWGSRVIDRLSADLRRDFPDMTGLPARNLKYMRALAEAHPGYAFVQQVVARLPWGHVVRLAVSFADSLANFRTSMNSRVSCVNRKAAVNDRQVCPSEAVHGGFIQVEVASDQIGRG